MNYCIFVERIFEERSFVELYNFCINNSGKVKLFCLTPINYNLVCAEQGYTGTKEELSKIMAERYHLLENTGCKIDLHVHLGLRLENIDQEYIFNEAVRWMNINNFSPSEWTAGWYIYNKKSREIMERYSVYYFKDKLCYSFHDYEYDKIFAPMMIITNLRGLLR